MASAPQGSKVAPQMADQWQKSCAASWIGNPAESVVSALRVIGMVYASLQSKSSGHGLFVE